MGSAVAIAAAIAAVAVAAIAGNVKAAAAAAAAAAAVDAVAAVVATEADVSHWTKGRGDAGAKKSTTRKKARKPTSVSEDF